MLASLYAKLIVGAIITAIVGGGVTYWSIHEYDKGYNAAIEAIAAKDREAVNAVNKAKSKVDDCNNGGGTWDSTVGVCRTK
jgi:uncharacterized protein (UPF0333 family)